MKTEKEYASTTVAYAGSILVCATYAQNDSQMVQGAAREAGLYPLKPKDRAILKKGLGDAQLAKFERLCRRD